MNTRAPRTLDEHLEQFRNELNTHGTGYAPNGATYRINIVPGHTPTVTRWERSTDGLDNTVSSIIVGFNGTRFENALAALAWCICDGRHERGTGPYATRKVLV